MVTALVLLVPTFAIVSGVHATADEDLDQLARSLVEEFVEIAMLPADEKRAALEDYLAPEFQIVRATGEALDKAAYVQDPSSVEEATIRDVMATAGDGVLVVSWVIDAVVTIDDVTADRSAPRLSVFHEGEDGRWRRTAHANLSVVEVPAG
jgi:hypothetical protein